MDELLSPPPQQTRKRAPSNAKIRTPSPNDNNTWFWIEEQEYEDGKYLGVEEGNCLDFKLTIFSDYMHFRTKSKTKQVIDIETEPNIIDYGKLGDRMIEYLIAFLNTNGGALLFGVADDSLVQAMELSEKQRDKIKLVLDSCIRNYQLTPVPKANIDYRLEFVLAKTDDKKEKFVIVLEVKKSQYFHYAHIRKTLASWERLNASNFYLCDRPQRFVSRIRELRDEDLNLEENYRVANALDGYVTLLFSDREIVVSEKVCSRAGVHKNIFRFETWCDMDSKGRFVVDRPFIHFIRHYEFLQIGAISVPVDQYPVFLLEADFYGLLGLYQDPSKVVTVRGHGSGVLIMTTEKHNILQQNKLI